MDADTGGEPAGPGAGPPGHYGPGGAPFGRRDYRSGVQDLPFFTGRSGTVPGTSTLTVGDQAALRSVGFRTAGLVSAGVVCTDQVAVWKDGPSARMQGGYAERFTSGRSSQQGWNVEQVVPERQREQAVRTALDRLADEAQRRGVHGVVGISLQTLARTDFPAAWADVLVVSEVVAAGTAVLAADQPPLPRPFLSHLTGAEVVVLLLGGAVPIDVCVARASVVAAMSRTTFRARASVRHGELAQYSAAVTECWRIAARRLEREASPAAGIVGVGVADQIHHATRHGYRVELELIGTAVATFEPVPTGSASELLRTVAVTDRRVPASDPAGLASER